VTFEIGPIFHLIHMSDDFWPLNDWYADVFGAVEFTKPRRTSAPGGSFPTWMVELRDASLITVADVTFEVPRRLGQDAGRPVLQQVRPPLALDRLVRR
jgi:hypothetical protein